MNEPGFDSMARLVNYKKRSITLPAGCKDLIAVIKPHEMHAKLNGIYGQSERSRKNRRWLLDDTPAVKSLPLALIPRVTSSHEPPTSGAA
jgi:hypothetical protein